jgi:hypothetical protein
VSTINKVYVMSVELTKPQLTITMETIVIGIVPRKEINNMNELNCKNCETPTACSEEAVAITCSDCVIELIYNINIEENI